MANLKEIAQWEDGIYQLERTDPVVGGEGGISNRQGLQLANRTAWLKQLVETLAPLDSPTFTGSPKAPTPAQTVNDTTIATTAFVKNAIAALVGSAPTTLDTLAEIATALGNDGKIKEVLLAEIAKKANTTDLNNLKNLLVGIPFPYPLAAVPSGCLAFNGQTFNKTTYPILAQKYPSGVLPDLRGEFIRGWDNGRGIDSGRGLLNAQAGSLLFGLDDNSAGGDAFVIANNNRNNTGWDAPQQSDYNITSPEFNIGFISALYSKINTMNGMYRGFASGIGVARPRNIAFQYICLAA